MACTDALGFRQLFWLAAAAAAMAGSRAGEPRLDLAAVAVQGLLGWQLGDRTLFDEVAKVPAGPGDAEGRDRRAELVPLRA